MPNEKETKKKGLYDTSNITVVDKLWPDLSKDPYFVKKLERATALHEKCMSIKWYRDMVNRGK